MPIRKYIEKVNFSNFTYLLATRNTYIVAFIAQIISIHTSFSEKHNGFATGNAYQFQKCDA